MNDEIFICQMWQVCVGAPFTSLGFRNAPRRHARSTRNLLRLDLCPRPSQDVGPILKIKGRGRHLPPVTSSRRKPGGSGCWGRSQENRRRFDVVDRGHVTIHHVLQLRTLLRCPVAAPLHSGGAGLSLGSRPIYVHPIPLQPLPSTSTVENSQVRVNQQLFQELVCRNSPLLSHL